MSLKPVYATEATVISTALDSLGNGSSAASTEQDNSTNRYMDARFDIEIAAAGANTGFCAIYLREGSATGKVSTGAQVMNMRYLDSVRMNGTTVIRKSIFVPNMPKFFVIALYNDSGGSLAASSNTIKMTGLNYEDV